MTRILRLLLIAAVALPLWQPTAAQELASVNDDAVNNKHISKAVCEVKDLSKMKVASLADALGMESDATDNANAVVDVNDKQPVGKWKFKTRSTQHTSTAIKVTKSRAAIPEGYASITLAAGNVWNDGTGYQMLLDANATAYGTIIPATGALTTSGDVPASTYAEFEYKIPENADGALTTTNMVLDSQATILIPAGTYDWCITNPTPEDRMWIASEQGDVQGRYDNYVFEAGLSYVFTVTKVGQNDNIVIEITNPDFNNPTSLAVNNIENHGSTLTWNAGSDESSWNVQLKNKKSFNWTAVGTTTTANYVFEDLLIGTEYQARVQAVYADGVSGWEQIAFTTTADGEDLCEPEEMGEITYSLNDSYGDGWNGASIAIVDAATQRPITTLTISSGSSSSGTVSLCYGRTVNFVWTAGDYATECSFTITDPNGVVIASKTTNQTITDGATFATYTMSYPPQTESLDFGAVDVGSTKTLTAKILNESSVAVQATLTVSTPFSVETSTVTLHSGLTAIPVTFTPTEARNYHGTLSVTIGGETTTIHLTGIGSMSGPEAVRDEAFFEGITYSWTDDEGTHTSNLTEVATKPEQIIALLKEVYTNQNIPGNLKRGFTATGGTDTYSDVSYSGVGAISRSSSGAYSYSNSLGWNIPNKTSFKNTSSDGYTFTYMDPTDYKPNVEGVTLLLIESADDYDRAAYTLPSSSLSKEDYLKSLVGTTIKSARVVTQAKRTGEGQARGTLFKIDCDKMNKFFLLGKGQLRWVFDSYWAKSSSGYYLPTTSEEACPEPFYMYKRNDQYGFNGYYNGDSNNPLFSHMFEQFSPVNIETGANIDDLYQSLVNMQSFGVYHDCITVPFAITDENNLENEHGHQFMMYGLDSESADCQDVRDLMFFVPDYRMMKDDNRDPVENYQKYVNYNTAHQPKMALFVIKQNPITGEQIANQDTYKLHLTWTSNLLDFLPGEKGQYTLYRVITNADGTKTYQAVGEFDPNTLEYYDNVPMQQTSQQVTYVVQGQDVGKFLSLQMSNEESYIIPGLDPSEIVLLEDATHYSRFDAQRVRNCYSNKFTLKNNVGGMKQANLTAETKLTITRIPQGGNIAPAEIAAVTFNPSSKTYTVQMAAQAADETEFPKCEDGSYAGYHANNGSVKGNGSWTGAYTVNSNGDINLGTLAIFDNFVQAIPDNNYHPIGYVYQVTSNYECAATSVYLNAANCTTGDEVWYAWTWNNDTDGKWLQGLVVEDDVLKFVPAKNNIIFARMNPAASNVPSWDAAWNQTGDLSTQGYIGKTFTINWGYNGAINGSWGGDVIPDMAHSNTFRIPVYKTSSQINGVFSKDEVDEDTDGALGVPKNVEFGVGVQLSSKSEILRYDTYRWGEQEPRYSVASADGDDEQDLPPTGQAMNQGQYYTISMNPDTSNETNGETSVSSGTGTATFVDKVPGESENAAAYMYAPIVEVFSGRGDYNSYGGPLQSAAVGKLAAERDNTPELMSKYNWTANGKKYAYYNIILNVSTKKVPAGYQIYKIRAWRTVDPSILGEEIITERLGDENGKYMFEEIKFGTEAMDNFINNDYELGEGDASVTVNGDNTISFTLGTFGAQKLRTDEEVGDNSVIDELNATFVVRMYFTRAANLPSTSGAPMLKDVATDADGKYYIVEQVIPFTQKGGNVPTGLESLDARQVVGVKYYNPSGIESDTPFQGVNIVVTRYSDGSSTTTKILK